MQTNVIRNCYDMYVLDRYCYPGTTVEAICFLFDMSVYTSVGLYHLVEHFTVCTIRWNILLSVPSGGTFYCLYHPVERFTVCTIRWNILLSVPSGGTFY